MIAETLEYLPHWEEDQRTEEPSEKTSVEAIKCWESCILAATTFSYEDYQGCDHHNSYPNYEYQG